MPCRINICWLCSINLLAGEFFRFDIDEILGNWFFQFFIGRVSKTSVWKFYETCEPLARGWNSRNSWRHVWGSLLFEVMPRLFYLKWTVNIFYVSIFLLYVFYIFFCSNKWLECKFLKLVFYHVRRIFILLP